MRISRTPGPIDRVHGFSSSWVTRYPRCCHQGSDFQATPSALRLVPAVTACFPAALARSSTDRARGRMRAKRDALVEALTGMFDDHHGELAQMLLDQIAFCDTRIAALATRIEQHLAQIPAAWGVDADGSTGPD